MRNVLDFFYTIGSMNQVYEFANLLVENWGMKFYVGDEFRGKDKKGRYTSRIELFKDIDKIAFLAKKGIGGSELVNAFDELVEQCYVICRENKLSFADVLCEATEYFSRTAEPTFDNDEEECNRQFRSMMDDNDAWGNID
ncbi:MAG: hypothetical protein NC405_03965 [Odoribacter sp.]|nr:hypothetical protein [Odoribacter sp.]